MEVAQSRIKVNLRPVSLPHPPSSRRFATPVGRCSSRSTMRPRARPPRASVAHEGQSHSKFSKTALWPQNFLRLRRARRGFAFGTVPHSPESATLTVIIIPVTPDSSSKPMVVGTYMGVRGLLEYPRSPLCGSPKTARAPAPPSPVRNQRPYMYGDGLLPKWHLISRARRISFPRAL